MTARIQTYLVAIIPAVLFGLDVLIAGVTTADGQADVDQEKINRQLGQFMKALDSGDIAAAVEYLKETAQELPTGEAKTHLEVAINALQTANDSGSARFHALLVQNSLQNPTG